MRIPFVCLALLLALPAARAASWTAVYELNAAGLRALEATFTFDVDGPNYRIEVRTRTRGLVGFFANSNQVTVAEGAWQGNEARPRLYRVNGVFRGQPRMVTMDWRPDGQPQVSALEPSNTAEQREVVAPSLLPGAIDALTAIVQLSRVVAQTGRCDVRSRLYDGRRLTQVTVRTAGMEAVPNGAGAQGLRCVLQTVPLAGLRTDQDQTRARTPVETTVWIARAAANAPPVPFRIELASQWWGSLSATLVRMEPVAP